MKTLEAIIKALLLIIHDYKVNNKLTTRHIVTVLLTTVNIKNIRNRDEKDIVNKTLALLDGILANKVVPNEEILLTLEILLVEKINYMKIITKYMLKDSTHVISTLEKELSVYTAKTHTKNILEEAVSSVMLPTTLNDTLINNVKVELDNVAKLTNGKNEYSVDSIDFSDIESVKKAASKAKDLISGGSVLNTGWEEFNDSVFGGLRRGEFHLFNALPNNYKSSMIKTLFLQIMRCNVPKLDDPTKTPLMLFISLEEEINNIMFFFYSYLKLVIENVSVDPKKLKDINIVEIAEFVYNEFRKYGYEVRVERVKPDLYDIYAFNKMIDDYKDQGFEIITLGIDYPKKMSREGCRNNGPMGTDLLDLFSRMRNRVSMENILTLAPHQLNPRTKHFLQNGMEDEEFTKFVANKGMYADSSQLDQELDGDFYLHLIKKEDKTYLSVTRGKHRLPLAIPEFKKSFVIEFISPTSPAIENTEKYKSSKRSINEANSDANDFF